MKLYTVKIIGTFRVDDRMPPQYLQQILQDKFDKKDIFKDKLHGLFQDDLQCVEVYECLQN